MTTSLEGVRQGGLNMNEASVTIYNDGNRRLEFKHFVSRYCLVKICSIGIQVDTTSERRIDPI